MGCTASSHIAVVTGGANFAASYNFNSIGVAELLIDRAGGHVTTLAASLLDCSAFVGCIIGMLTFGYLGDRFGRRRAMALTLAISTLGAAMSGLTAGVDGSNIEASIIAWRVMLGIGLGGAYPLSATLAYESVSDEDAYRASSADRQKSAELKVAYANFWQCVAVEALYCITLVVLALPGSYTVDWRLVLALGAVPCLVSAASLWAIGLVESAEFSAVTQTHGAALLSPGDFLARVRRDGHLTSLVAASMCWALYNMVAYGFLVYAPEILETVLGNLSVWQNLRVDAGATVFQFVGGVVSLPLMERVGSRLALALGGAVMSFASLLIGVACFGSCSSAPVAIGLMCFARFGMQLPGVPVFTLPNVLFPTEIRASCHGVAAAVGKVGAAVGTYAFPILIDALGVGPVFLIAGVLCVGLVAVALVFVPPAEQSLSKEKDELSTSLLPSRTK